MVRQAHHERFDLANITRFLGLPNFQCMKKDFRDGVAPAIIFTTRFVGCLVASVF
jgi:hypothetical protein